MTLKNNTLLFGVFGLIFGILLLFNILFPPQADDLSMYFTAKEGNLLQSYFSWNARIGEILYTGYFARFVDSIIFDVINAAMGVLFILCFFVLFRGSLPKDKQDYLTLMLMCALILLFSCFGSTFLWGAGAFNYLWGIGFILLFLLPFRFFWGKFYNSIPLENAWTLKSLFIGILFGFFAIGAGMASEHIGLALCVVLLLSIGLAFYKKIKIPLWYLFGCLGFWTGWILLFLSPAAKNRMSYSIENKIAISLSELFNQSFLEKLITINSTFNHAYSISFCSFLIIFTLFYIFKTNKKLKTYQWIALVPLWVAALAWTKNICALLVFGVILILMIKLARKEKFYYWFVLIFGVWLFIALIPIQFIHRLPQRARLGDSLLLFIMILMMFKEFYCANLKRTTKIISVLLLFGIGFVGFNCYQIFNKWSNLTRFVAQEKALGETNIIIAKQDKKRYLIRQKYFIDFAVIGEDMDSWSNQILSKYLEVESIRIE
ncbi:hypothetical protein LS70_003520 [Helicobacter sp. MIT 11-5569]|uniref:DUF6056 family protein n=1 Tax=Helicobacter sp. MIT 11-5569 TaxID=1548151 RepID=UPI00051FC813|nr:DUF6056 family protein [Helicobacter sp. MIT 11-5569]TLD83888.1 hypothetical protein LS70_003520 [Helicobacter sp. MIT 11-5569]